MKNLHKNYWQKFKTGLKVSLLIMVACFMFFGTDLTLLQGKITHTQEVMANNAAPDATGNGGTGIGGNGDTGAPAANGNGAGGNGSGNDATVTNANGTDNTTGNGNEDPAKLTKTQINFSEIIAWLLSCFTPLIAVMAKAMGSLLGNDWIYGSAGAADKVEMKNVLNVMWRIVRDLVNYVFIVILVAVALMNVLSAGSSMHDKFAVKTVLPKIILALVAVNFTWFGAKLVLDTANVATHIVFAIPQTVSQSTASTVVTSDSKICIPDNVTINETSTTATKNSGTKSNCPATETNYGKFKITWKESKITDVMGPDSIGYLVAFSVLHIERLPLTLNTQDINYLNMSIDALMGLVLMIILLLVFASMTIVLFLRIIFLWLNIILSPVFVLLPILSELSIPTGGEDTFGLKAFAKQAFMPAMMALPLVVGMTMVIVGQKLTLIDVNNADTLKVTEMLKDTNAWQQIMWYALTIVILWSSVKVATSSSEIAGSIIGTVGDPLKRAATWLAKSPQYLPLIPVKADLDGNPDNKDYASLSNVLEAPFLKMGEIENKSRQKALALAGIEQKTFDKMPSGVKAAIRSLNKDQTKLTGALQAASTAQTPENFWQRLRDTQGISPTDVDALKSQSPQDIVQAMIDINPSLYKDNQIKSILTNEKLSTTASATPAASTTTNLTNLNVNASVNDVKTAVTAIAESGRQQAIIDFISKESDAAKQKTLAESLAGMGAVSGIDWNAVKGKFPGTATP